MAWTNESAERAVEWLNENSSRLKCSCETGNWTLDSNLAAVPVVPPHDGEGIQVKMGPYFVFLVVMCTNCREVRMFHAGGLGLLDDG